MKLFIKSNDVINVPIYLRLKQDYINIFLQATLRTLLNFASKIWCHFVSNLQNMTLYPHMYQNVYCNLLKKPSVYRRGLYISVYNWSNIVNPSLCLVPFQRRQIVLSRKVCYFVLAYI